MKEGEAARLLNSMEQSKTFVAAMTGIKNQFVEAGWHERTAEQMVHVMLWSTYSQTRTEN